MSLTKYKKIFLLLLLLSITPVVTQAESVIWSKTLGDYKIELYLFGFTMHHPVYKPNAQVEYKTRVYNASTGKVIPCGSTVPAGTTLAYQFMPHSYKDISWFGTGRVQDSPYGEWISKAGRGKYGACHTKNIIKTKVKKKGQGWVTAKKSDKIALLVNFSVNPPKKSISGLPSGQCKNGANSSKICTLTTEGTVNAKYNFAATYGQFWGGLMMGGGCTDTTAYGRKPMKSGSKSKVTISAKTINCPITVQPVAGKKPWKPLVEASCVVGKKSTISIVATDTDTSPSNSDLRYLFDWDSDGKLDQVVPPTGYVPTNTKKNVQHTWSTEGRKMFKVAAQDKKGLHSGWKSIWVDCVNEEDFDEDSDGSFGAAGIDEDPLGGVIRESTEPELTPEEIEARRRAEMNDRFPDGKVELELSPKITNTTCKATWDSYSVQNCQFYTNNQKVSDVDIFGELDVTPGTHRVSCSSVSDGTIVSAAQICKENVDFREI